MSHLPAFSVRMSQTLKEPSLGVFVKFCSALEINSSHPITDEGRRESIQLCNINNKGIYGCIILGGKDSPGFHTHVQEPQ